MKINEQKPVARKERKRRAVARTERKKAASGQQLNQTLKEYGNMNGNKRRKEWE
jgi:hypothetical protein